MPERILQLRISVAPEHVRQGHGDLCACGDGLVHRRYKVPLDGKSKYWKRLIQAHRIHHAVGTKQDCVSFGFLIAPPVRRLKAELTALQEAE